MKRIIYLLTLLVILAVGCSKNIDNRPAEEKMADADAFFAKKKYAKAAILYQDIIFERTTLLTSVAQMKLADCYFADDKFYDARLEYEQMIKLFPDNENIADAYYKIGVCYFEESLPAHYTQEETNSAINAFTVFLDKFPNDPRKDDAIKYIQDCQFKLLEKKYENGRIYFKMEDYSGALLYLQEIMDLGNSNELDMNSHLFAGQIYKHWEQYDVAKAHLAVVMDRYPDTKAAKKARKVLMKIKKLEESAEK